MIMKDSVMYVQIHCFNCWLYYLTGDEFPRRLCDPLSPVILFYHVSLQPTRGNIKQQSQGVGGNRVYVGICHPYLTAIMHYYYYTLNSLSLFWLAKSVQWFFCNQRLWCHNCRIYNNHVKDTKGHGKSCPVHGAWFLRVIMSSLLALPCLPSVKK